jgi:SHS2 domain-containing protein
VEGPPFEEIRHTADWAIRVRGRDLDAVFVHAAQAMLAWMAAEPLPDTPRPYHLELSAADPPGLLVRWLEEILFRVETEHVGMKHIEVTILAGNHLQATLHESGLAHIGRHIKAVTYHDLSLLQSPQGVEATVVFDV